MRSYVIATLIVVISNVIVDGRHIRQNEISEFNTEEFSIPIDWKYFGEKRQISDTTAHRRIRRRAYIIRCCHFVSCTSNRRRGNGRYTPYVNEAIAAVSGEGITVTCPRCPPNWQNNLDLGRGKGYISVTCVDCPDGWKEMLNVDAASEATVEVTDSTEAATDADTAEAAPNSANKNSSSSAAAATTATVTTVVTTVTTVKAAVAAAAVLSTVAVAATTAKAVVAALPAIPAGLDLSKLPPGVDLSKIPPGMDMSKIPAGMDLSKLPPGMDLASLALLGKK